MSESAAQSGSGRSESTVICGVDGSPDSVEALRVAGEFAKNFSARLLVAHVSDPIQSTIAHAEFSAGGSLRRVPTSVTQSEVEQLAGEEILERTIAEADAVEVERRVLSGPPADSLAALADDVGAAMIVVGSRGHGGLKTLVLGSVSNRLIAIARCPVVIVPPGVETARGSDQ